jgi:hypothetical protein
MGTKETAEIRKIEGVPLAGDDLARAGSRRTYGLGDVSAGLVVSVVVAGVVAAGLDAGSVVSVFCSHAARSAAPARMQMYFFMA